MVDMPTRRRSVKGVDLDGRRVELSVGISRNLYRCPGCRESIEIGREHVIVDRDEESGRSFHQHWHTDCARVIGRELAISRGKSG
jgi:uncharacterized membrane protein